MKSKATLATVFTLASVLLYACAGNIPITGQDTPPPTEIAEEADVVATSAPIEEGSSGGISLANEATACQTPTASIKADKAYLREGPDIRYAGSAQYKKGDKFTVLGRYKDWFQVKASNDDKGWLYKDWLSFPSNVDADSLCSINSEDLPPTPQTAHKTPQNNECTPTYYVSCP
jgi:Bacterial SH3 domain